MQLFSCAWKAGNVIKKKGVRYHVDLCAAKAAKIFLVCESQIDPYMRVKTPAAMMAKGYSNEESKNRTLQMQVCREVEKIRGLDPPRPPEAVMQGEAVVPSRLDGWGVAGWGGASGGGVRGPHLQSRVSLQICQ